METRILELRKMAGLSQDNYEIYLGVIQRTVSNIERGLCINYNFEVIVKYAVLYDVSIEYLMGLTNIAHEFPKDQIKSVIIKYNIDVKILKFFRKKIAIYKTINKTNNF